MVYYSTKVLLCKQDNVLAMVLHCFVTVPLQNDYCFLPRREYCFCACLSLVKTSKNNLQNMKKKGKKVYNWCVFNLERILFRKNSTIKWSYYRFIVKQ